LQSIQFRTEGATIAGEFEGLSTIEQFTIAAAAAPVVCAEPLSGAWLLNFFYEVLSDYGQSIGRPLLWIVVCFAIGYIVFAGTHVFNGTHLTRAGAAALSFANIFSFLSITREIMTHDLIAGLSTWAQILGAAQSLFGAVVPTVNHIRPY
jgi:hypothetical protein